jgi:transposase
MPAPYPTEFRERAVELAREGSTPVAQVAKDLGISESCLRNWMPAPTWTRAGGRA